MGSAVVRLRCCPAACGTSLSKCMSKVTPTLSRMTMSRSLGKRQRLLLAALCRLEADEGRTGEFYVWAIVNAASKLGLNADAVAKRRRIAAERKMAALELEAQAASGDVDAQDRLHNRDRLERF